MSNSSSNGITGFIEIFEGRLQKMKLHLKEELSKAKSERSRATIKRITADARKLNRTLKEMRNVSAKKCPHCGEKI
jgi:YgiT-type zinc finger domain-containing protein